MKILKGAAATLVLAVAISASPLDRANAMVAENQKYAASAGSITEDFETITAAELIAKQSPIVDYFTNTPDVQVETDDAKLPSGVGRYLRLTTNNSGDACMLTKQELFKYDVTVVDLYLRNSTPGDKNNTGGICSQVILRDDVNGKRQTLLEYLYSSGAGKLRALQDQSVNYSVKWIPVRIILDRPNQSITVTTAQYSTTGITATKTFTDWSLSNKAYLQIQTFSSNVLGIDDITISDGFYLENDYINDNFEHVRSLNANHESLTSEYGRASVNMQATADSVTENTYLSLTSTAAGAVMYAPNSNNANAIHATAEKPTVISFRLKTDETSNLSVSLRHSSGSADVAAVNIANGIASLTSTRTVNDGNFHSYRLVLTPKTGGAGFTISTVVDGVWLGTVNNGSFNMTTGGIRVHFKFPNSGTVVGLDDFHVFYPDTLKLRGKFENTNIDVDGSLTFEGNNPLNYSTVKASAFILTETGTETTVPIKEFSSSDFVTRNNTFTLAPAQDLKPNTSYTLSVADNTLRDMYEQYYSGEIASFTTGEEPETQYRLTYTVNGEEVSGTECLAAGTLGVTLDVRAYSAGANALAVAALYNDSDQLIRTEVLHSVLSAAGTGSETGNLIINSDEIAGAKVKLFLWDGATYAPLQRVIPLTAAAD